MNASELAKTMLEWESLTNQANELAAKIKDAVFEIRETQTVGNVRASYSNGRKTYDYQTPAATAPKYIIDAHTEVITKIDFRAICKETKIEPIITGQSAPSVTVKLLK